jgi:hypothetical protein
MPAIVMPTLQFLLTVNSFAHCIDKGSEEWILMPDAIFQRNYRNFEVFVGPDKYNGFELEYSITIKQRTPVNIDWIAKLAQFSLQASNGKLNENIVDRCSGSIALIYSIEHQIPPNLEIIILLPSDTFFRTQEYLEKYDCHLSLQTDPFEAGLIYGDDPDGKDIRWLADKVEVAIVKSISFQFKPRQALKN